MVEAQLEVVRMPKCRRLNPFAGGQIPPWARPRTRKPTKRRNTGRKPEGDEYLSGDVVGRGTSRSLDDRVRQLETDTRSLAKNQSLLALAIEGERQRMAALQQLFARLSGQEPAKSFRPASPASALPSPRRGR